MKPWKVINVLEELLRGASKNNIKQVKNKENFVLWSVSIQIYIYIANTKIKRTSFSNKEDENRERSYRYFPYHDATVGLEMEARRHLFAAKVWLGTLKL